MIGLSKKLLFSVLIVIVLPFAAYGGENDLFLKRYSLYAWIGGGLGSQSTIASAATPEGTGNVSLDFGAYGFSWGGGLAYNDLFTPNLRVGVELNHTFVAGKDKLVGLATMYQNMLVARPMIGYIFNTSIGGIEPYGFFGLGVTSVSWSAFGYGTGGSSWAMLGGGGVYWTPKHLRWLSVGTEGKYGYTNSVKSYFDPTSNTAIDIDTDLFMISGNVRFQRNFGK